MHNHSSEAFGSFKQWQFFGAYMWYAAVCNMLLLQLAAHVQRPMLTCTCLAVKLIHLVLFHWA